MDECGVKNINKVVLKFGGSVLYGKTDFERISREINRYVLKNYQVVAVVSAYFGVTEKLFDKAARLKAIPSSAAFAEIVASGEFESALELVSYLIHNGHKVCLRTPSEFNFLAAGDRDSARPISISAKRINSSLTHAPVIIMPGFSAIDEQGDCILLGRGGSDISAVCVSQALGLNSVRLLKDVDGLYNKDPNKFPMQNDLTTSIMGRHEALAVNSFSRKP